MATSQNGWPASADKNAIDVDSGFSRHGVTFPGGVKAGDVSTLLGYVIDQFHRRVEALVSGWCWGYTYKQIAGSTVYSNHASGTAVDINAPDHPYGVSGTFTPAEVAAIHAILGEVSPAVRWGGDYTGNKDDMHFEINANAATVADVAARLGGAGGSTPEPEKRRQPRMEHIAVLEAAGGWREMTLPMALGDKSQLFARAWLSLAGDRGGKASVWFQGAGMDTVFHQPTLAEDARWWTEIPDKTECIVLHAEGPGSLGLMLEFQPR